MLLNFIDYFFNEDDEIKEDNKKSPKYNPYNLFLIFVLLVLSEDALVKQIIKKLSQ